MDATCRHLLRRAHSEVMKKIDGEPIFDRHLMRQGAYLLHNVIDEAINSDPTVINALMERLQVPETVATHNQMSDHEKKVAIEAQIEHYSQTPSSLWVWRAAARNTSSINLALRRRVSEPTGHFGHVLRSRPRRGPSQPVARWLQGRGDEPYMEIQLGGRRIDVLGHNKRGPRLTAVELKNSDEEFWRLPDQMGSFAE